jgi:hypothetical protein
MKTRTFVVALMAVTALPSAAKTEPQRAAGFQKACNKCGCFYFSIATSSTVSEECSCSGKTSAGHERSTCFTNATGITNKSVSQKPDTTVYRIKTIESPARKN